MLAGIVQATLRGTTLDIRGDAAANHIVVRQESPSNWQVKSGDGSTSISTQDHVGVIRNLRVRLEGGDDLVTLEEINFAGNISILTGEGTETVSLAGVTANDLRITNQAGAIDLSVVAGTQLRRIELTNRNGAATTSVDNAHVLRNVSTRVMNGLDELSLSSGLEVGGNLIRTTRGGDSVTTLADTSRVNGMARISVASGYTADFAQSDDASVGRLVGMRLQRLRNQVYSRPEGERLLADVTIPPSTGPHPAVLLIHGGYWRFGNKSNMRRQADFLAARGYTVVSIDYRLAPQATMPLQIYDVKAAVRWMRANADRFRIDPDRIAA